jgi:hypothetical protein
VQSVAYSNGEFAVSNSDNGGAGFVFASGPLVTISDVTVSLMTATNAFISWTVDSHGVALSNNLVSLWLDGDSVTNWFVADFVSGTGIASASLTNLVWSTNYNFCVLSDTGLNPGTYDTPSASSNGTFATLPPVRITSGPTATNIASDSATILWTIENDTGLPATNTLFYVQLPDGAWGFTNVETLVSGQAFVSLDGLQPGTNYMAFLISEAGDYGAFAPTNENGLEFSTAPAQIWISTSPTVTNLTANSATVRWQVENASGLSASHLVSYTWWDGSGKHTSSQTANFDPATHTASATISNLQPGFAYSFYVQSAVDGPDGTRNGYFAVDGLDVPYRFRTIQVQTITTFSVGATAITDTNASIVWHVNKVSPSDIARHYVVLATNALPFTIHNAIITEGLEDANGTVTANLTGLAPAKTNYYYVQSIIDFSKGHYATDINGGSFYSFTTQPSSAPPGPPATTNDYTSVAILDFPVADAVGVTDAIVSWKVAAVPDSVSHYLVFSPDAALTPTNSLIATAAQTEPGSFSSAIAALEGLAAGQEHFYYVQSVIDAGADRHAVMPKPGYLNWFVTATDAIDANAGGPIESGLAASLQAVGATAADYSAASVSSGYGTNKYPVAIFVNLGGSWDPLGQGDAVLNWAGPAGTGRLMLTLASDYSKDGLAVFDPGETQTYTLTLTAAPDYVYNLAAGIWFTAPPDANLCLQFDGFDMDLYQIFPEEEPSGTWSWGVTLVKLTIGGDDGNLNEYVDRHDKTKTWADRQALPKGKPLHIGDYACWKTDILPADRTNHVLDYTWRAIPRDGRPTIYGPTGAGASEWKIAEPDGISGQWTAGDYTIRCDVTLQNPDATSVLLTAEYEQRVSGTVIVGFLGADEPGAKLADRSKLNPANQKLTDIGGTVGATMFPSIWNIDDAESTLLHCLDSNSDGRYDPYALDPAKRDILQEIDLFGFSWGGTSAVSLAREIKTSGLFRNKDVELVTVLDPVTLGRWFPPAVPDNVERFWNRFQSHGADPIYFFGSIPMYGRSLEVAPGVSPAIVGQPMQSDLNPAPGLNQAPSSPWPTEHRYINHYTIIWEMETQLVDLLH